MKNKETNRLPSKPSVQYIGHETVVNLDTFSCKRLNFFHFVIWLIQCWEISRYKLEFYYPSWQNHCKVTLFLQFLGSSSHIRSSGFTGSQRLFKVNQNREKIFTEIGIVRRRYKISWICTCIADSRYRPTCDITTSLYFQVAMYRLEEADIVYYLRHHQVKLSPHDYEGLKFGSMRFVIKLNLLLIYITTFNDNLLIKVMPI